MNDVPLDDILEPRGIFTTPDSAHNARQALAYWERHQDATILTTGAAYLVYRDAVAVAKGWWQIAPEEMVALVE